MSASYEDKVKALRRRLRKMEGAVVAFSGGVDSSVLASLAFEELGNRMVAATAVSPGTPGRDLDAAAEVCRTHGIPHSTVETREFEDAAFLSNPEDRCYICKKLLYEALTALADRLSFAFVVEGTNASDLGGHRPGYRASQENPRVATPLIEEGFTKEEVRRLAASLCLQSANKPASACLASRVPAGVSFTPELMRRIDAAEEVVREFAKGQVRVRHHGELARIELDGKELSVALEHRLEIDRRLRELGWKFVSLDLLGYRTGGAK
ncbi:MAG TPA: ATP-dependent sacrificial sulfur transferase LarE [bacterium]|nr:ATP-dependent sacrificial sulfur transferase LarE [bacterium]